MGRLFVDQYSFLHYAVGVIAYFFDIEFAITIILHIIFEVIENRPWMIHFINRHLTAWPGGKPYADSVKNSVGDTLFTGLGWYSAMLLDTVGAKRGWYSVHIT